MVRAAPCQGAGRGFNSLQGRSRSYGSVAERLPFKQLQVGPIPTGITLSGHDVKEAC